MTTKLLSMLAAAIVLCCEGAVAQKSAGQENLDPTVNAQVRVVSHGAEVPKPKEPIWQVAGFETGGIAILLGIMLFYKRYAAGRPQTERRAADEGAVAKYAESLSADRGVDDFEIALSPQEMRKAQELATAFIESAGPDIEAMRYQVEQILQIQDLRLRQKVIEAMNMNVRSAASDARAARLKAHFRLASALQHLIGNFAERPGQVSVSGLETARTTLDLMKELCTTGQNHDLLRQPIRALVVDGDATVRDAISLALQPGFDKPQTADSGEAAVELARQHRFDIVFVSVLLPGMDGFAACGQIRETQPNRETPVVFLMSQPQNRQEAGAAGGWGFVPKPALASEVALAAVTFALCGRLQKLRAAEPAIV